MVSWALLKGIIVLSSRKVRKTKELAAGKMEQLSFSSPFARGREGGDGIKGVGVGESPYW